MAITPINNRYPGFIFDGENSRNYGVYITDVEVFGAPKRNVEMVTIPGRNGSYALDKGSFENVSVKYECALGAGTEEDFNNGISDFRNWLASKVGYKVLSDEINLGEYRKAVFLEGMEVPTLNKKTGTFEIVFDCMPQRWLDDASALPVEMASGDDIFNPTLFEASPLLSVWGYGNIAIGGGLINVQDSPIGSVTIGGSGEDTSPVVIEINGSQLENGDTITISRVEFMTIVGAPSGKSFDGDSAFTTSPYFTQQDELSAGGYWNVYFSYAPQTFAKGTASNKNTSFTATYGLNDGTDNTAQYSVTYSYDGDSTFTFSVTITPQMTQYKSATCSWSEIVGNSTQSSLGNPLYIDLEIGEAYKVEGGRTTGVNNAVSLPAKLPTLKPGHNAITFDNTVDKLVITPRWWKV